MSRARKYRCPEPTHDDLVGVTRARPYAGATTERKFLEHWVNGKRCDGSGQPAPKSRRTTPARTAASDGGGACST